MFLCLKFLPPASLSILCSGMKDVRPWLVVKMDPYRCVSAAISCFARYCRCVGALVCVLLVLRFSMAFRQFIQMLGSGGSPFLVLCSMYLLVALSRSWGDMAPIQL